MLHIGRTAQPASGARKDVQYVALAENIVPRLATHEARRLDLPLAPQAEQIVALHRLGPHKAAGQVAVDAVGRLLRSPPPPD